MFLKPYSTTLSTGVMLAGIVMLTSACVSKGKYEQLEAKNANLQLANEQLVISRQNLYRTNIILNREIEIREEDIAILEAEQEELLVTMDALIQTGEIEIELMKNGLNLRLDESVMFDSGSATLKPSGIKAINALVNELKSVPYQVVVTGNTDNVPIGPKVAERFPSNWALAAARAAAVVKLMEADGIPKRQLVAVSFGDTRPIATNDTPEGRAENRRIEVRLRPVVEEETAE